VICLRSQKINESLGWGILKCGGSLFANRFDIRIAPETVLHELLQNWPGDRRKDYDTGANWPAE
jgi:hypothetical protein